MQTSSSSQINVHEEIALATEVARRGQVLPDQSMFSMRLLVLGALVLTATGCVSVKNIRSEAITPEFQPTLTVMTFNIRHGCGRDYWGETSGAFFRVCPKNYDDIIAAIRSADPDVVGLQEIGRGQARRLARALNMNYAYSNHNSSGYGSWWGNAVLSKFRLLESRKISIGGSAGRNRSMLSAIGEVNGRSIAFICVHADPRLTDNRSVQRIRDYTSSIDIPVILIGDFNMKPGSPKSNALLTGSGIIDTAGSPGYGEMGTWDSPSGKRIDYVFVQSKHFRVLDAALVAFEHQHASDHIAYYTTLELR